MAAFPVALGPPRKDPQPGERAAVMSHPFRYLSIQAAAVLGALLPPGFGAGPAPALLDAPARSPGQEGGARGSAEDPIAAVEALRDRWLVETGTPLGESADGSWVGSGVAEVGAPPGPGWGAARLAAFRRAEQEARALFVEHTGIEVTVESIAGLFEERPGWLDDPGGGATPGADRLTRIEEKLASLDEATQGRALALLGISPDELATLAASAKRERLAEAFRTRVVARAAANLAGLRVIQTFEEHAGERHAVCALVRWSEENARLAEVLRTGKGTIAPAEAGRPVERWIPANDDLLLRTWGVRVFPGPGGEPLLLAFDQAPVLTDPRGGGRALEARRRAALQVAQTSALGALTLFVDCATASEQQLDRGERFEAPGGPPRGAPALTEALVRTITSRGAAEIQGGTVVRTWNAQHPDTGDLFCGVVVAWSPTRARLALGSGSGAKADGGKPIDF